MAATTAAVGTALVTGYGFANDFANTPTGQEMTAMGRNAILQAEMARLRAETESLRKRVAETNVEEFKVRADELKKRMKEQVVKTPAQTGGAVGTRRTAPPSAEEVARLKDRLVRLKGLVTQSSALISADYGSKVDELNRSADELSSQSDGDLYSLYGTFINALTNYIARPGLGSRAVDTAWATLTTRRRSSGALTSPAQSVGTDPGLPQSPAPQEPVPALAPPAPPAPQSPGASAPPAPQSPGASAPQPPAPQEPSLLATLTSDLSTATGGTGDADIDALIAEVDELIKTVTIPTVRASYETLKSIEARFEDLVEKRKFENTPEGIKIRWIDTMKRDLPALGEEIATLWDTMSGNLGRVPAPLVRHLFETWHALRTLEAEFGENRLSVESGTERLSVVREELAKIKSEYEGLGLGPQAPAPAPPAPAPPDAISTETAAVPIPPSPEAPAPQAPVPAPAPQPPEAPAPQAPASIVTPPSPGPPPVSTIHPRLLVESRQALVSGERAAAQLNEPTRALAMEVADSPTPGNFAGGCTLQDEITSAIDVRQTLVAQLVSAVNTLKRVFASYQRETAGIAFVSDAEFREGAPPRTTPLTVQAGGGETLIQLKKRLEPLLDTIRAGVRKVPGLVAETTALRERLRKLRQTPRLETPEACAVPVSASSPAPAPIVQSTETLPTAAVPLEVPPGETFQIENPMRPRVPAPTSQTPVPGGTGLDPVEAERRTMELAGIPVSSAAELESQAAAELPSLAQERLSGAQDALRMVNEARATGRALSPAQLRESLSRGRIGSAIPGARGALGAIGTPGLGALAPNFTSAVPSSRAGTVRRSKGGSRKKRLTSRRGNKTNVRGSRRR